MSGRTAWVAVLGGMAVLLGATCTGQAGQAETKIKLVACGVRGIPARCGGLAVPENPANPSGRTITLRVVVLPATTAQRAPDPLFYLEGGPGGAASQEAAWVHEHFSTLNRNRDIVMVDQRGTGGSNEVRCTSADTIETCMASVQEVADAQYYTTPLAVDDFDRVRVGLGYDRVDVYGVSYGVSSGLAYVQGHGAHVRAAVFDSGSRLDFHIYEQVPRSAQQSLQRLFARCHSDAACAAAFPDPDADFAKVMTLLTNGPVTTNVVDPTSGAYVVVGTDSFLDAVLSGYLAVTGSAPRLPRDIHAAARGDWAAIGNAVLAQAAGGQSIPAMAVTIRCSDDWSAHDASRGAASAPGSPFTSYEVQFLSDLTAVCSRWPTATGASGRVKSEAPIVFLNSTADPADPPENVAGVESDMPNSVVVPVAGTGHWQLDADTTGCLDEAVAAFIAAGKRSTEAQWTCAFTPPLPPFAID